VRQDCNTFFERQEKLTALSAEIAARDPTVFPAWKVLRLATIEAVQAGDKVGSLEAGKQSDLILVDLAELNLHPVLEAPVHLPACGGQPSLSSGPWSMRAAATRSTSV
jgi:5-methylthioadenosine/S-adenosylhomocysteine deaminase